MAFYFFLFPFSFSRVGCFGLDQIKSGPVGGLGLKLWEWEYCSSLAIRTVRLHQPHARLLVGWLARQTVMTIGRRMLNMMGGCGMGWANEECMRR